MSLHTHTHTHTLITVFILQLSNSDTKHNSPIVIGLDYLSVLRRSGDAERTTYFREVITKFSVYSKKSTLWQASIRPSLWASVAILLPAAAPILRKWQSAISGFIRVAPFIRRPTPNGRQATLAPSSAMRDTHVTNALLYVSIVLYQLTQRFIFSHFS